MSVAGFCSSKRGRPSRPCNRKKSRPTHRAHRRPAATCAGSTPQVLDVPGHRWAHRLLLRKLARRPPLLFCGDTLFSGGCGRLFEGHACADACIAAKLSALPDTPRCVVRMNTPSNLKFALAVEPTNEALLNYNAWCAAQRASGRPTLLSGMAQERAINPFCGFSTGSRTSRPGLCTADRCQRRNCRTGGLAQWKNEFR